MISAITNFAYELPHELPNNLNLRFLGKLKMKRKLGNWVETLASL